MRPRSIQIDAYAARFDLKGLPQAELPSVRQTLKEGWYFIFVFVLLVWMLIFMQRKAVAPFYATALLLVINQVLPYQRWSWKDVGESLTATARLFAELIAILAAIGILLFASAMQGYLLVVGDLCRHRVLQWPIRALLLIAGLCVALPGGGAIPLSNAELSVIGAAAGIPAALLAWWFNRVGAVRQA